MAFTKLTEKHLPGFIFIIDSIIKEDIEVDYRNIADNGVGHKNSIDARTIQRAFELRWKLEGKFNGTDIYRTSSTTLNVLTSYYLEDTEAKFLDFTKNFSVKIKSYYEQHRPNQNCIDDIFNPKIGHIAKQKETCSANLKELNENSLSSYLEGVETDFNDLKEGTSREVALKKYIIEHLEQRIKDLEEKLSHARSIYKRFGSLGLFFVSVDYDVPTKESIITDFVDDYLDAGEDEDFLEDLI